MIISIMQKLFLSRSARGLQCLCIPSDGWPDSTGFGCSIQQWQPTAHSTKKPEMRLTMVSNFPTSDLRNALRTKLTQEIFSGSRPLWLGVKAQLTSATFSAFCWMSFTLGVSRTLSEQMGNSRRVTGHPVYFGSPILQQSGVWAKRNVTVSEYKRAPVARASTCLFLAVPWCCVIGGAVTSQPLPFYKGLAL